jgi:protein-L-isoaspartate(D-aspartate) O-methyltransferase
LTTVNSTEFHDWGPEPEVEPAFFAARRHQLVRVLEVEGIRDPRVLAVLREVPRHLFVPAAYRDAAYENRALSIGEGQTISQPFVVAMMTEALALSGREKVLEVGTGSGYQAAVLSRLADWVHTIERSDVLHREAAERLKSLGVQNVTCHLGDGTRGLEAEAPFDAIVVTAASPQIPEPLRSELAPGGRLVIPVGDRNGQTLLRLWRRASGDEVEEICGVVFVPLVGEFGWTDGEPA